MMQCSNTSSPPAGVRLRSWLIRAAALFAWATAPLPAVAAQAPPPAAPVRTPLQQSLTEVARVEQRIATIGHRLAVANRALCRDLEWRLGLVTHAFSQYAPAARPEVASLFGFSSGVAVLAVASGGPAARAGVLAGDIILEVDGQAPPQVGEGDRASFAQAEALLERLEDAARDGVVLLQVQRRGRQLGLRIAGEQGCASRFQLRLSDDLNAGADGRYVQISTRVAEFARGDDELAGVAAHELAHNILGHRARLTAAGIQRGLLQNFGRSARLTRETEMEADRLSIRLMHAAGYDPNAAVRYLDRALRHLWMFAGGTHPPRRQRLAAMQEEIAKLPTVRR